MTTTKITDLPIQAVAQRLGGTVRLYEDRDHSADIVTPTCVLYCRIDYREKKLKISINNPAYKDIRNELQTVDLYKLLTDDEQKSGAFCTAIGCSISKTADAIAKDVTRRLLAPWGEVFPRIRQEIDEHNTYARLHDERVARFVKAFRYRQHTHDSQVLRSNGNGLPDLQVSPSSVRIDNFYCSEAAAMKILEILKGDKQAN